MPKRIYIADDDDNIREAIKAFLENEGYAVHAFADGDSLFAEFRQSPCDLVILDVLMPGSDGFSVCRMLREISTVPIIMLTARDSDFDYAMGISLGSDDYFTKPFSPTALVMRVRAIFRRIEYEQNRRTDTEAKPLSFGGILLDRGCKKVTAGGTEIDLTPNEFEVLAYLMERPGEAVSRSSLLSEVWGFETEIETRATDDTVRRLRRKIEESDVEIAAVWGFGFRLRLKGGAK